MNEYVMLFLNHVVGVYFTNTIDFTNTDWNCFAVSSYGPISRAPLDVQDLQFSFFFFIVYF